MSDKIKLKLPDESILEVDRGSSAGEAALSISRRLALDAVAASINGELIDLGRPLDHDGDFEVITFESRRGKEVFWHSSAHVMAEAVQQLFPGTKLAIGPPIEEGFYYDFDKPDPFTEADLEHIEKRMQEIIDADADFARREYSLEEARAVFDQRERDSVILSRFSMAVERWS